MTMRQVHARKVGHAVRVQYEAEEAYPHAAAGRRSAGGHGPGGGFQVRQREGVQPCHPRALCVRCVVHVVSILELKLLVQLNFWLADDEVDVWYR